MTRYILLSILACSILLFFITGLLGIGCGDDDDKYVNQQVDLDGLKNANEEPPPGGGGQDDDVADDDAADDDAADDDAADDDAADDDAADDDAADDDASDDDTDTPDNWTKDEGGPTITNPGWGDASVSLSDQNPQNSFSCSVCDTEGNLDGGRVYMWKSGTSDDFLASPIYWKNGMSVYGDTTNCDTPALAAVQIGFKGASPGDVCVDFAGKDNAGNRSDIFKNICFTLTE